MEGLEISEILFSNLDRIKLRYDAEFYQKDFIALTKKISLMSNVKLSNSGARLDCSAFYPSIADSYNFAGEGIPFLRVNEIQDGLVSVTDNTAFLPQSVLDENPGTICVAQPNDIVIAKGGNTLAKLGLLTEAYSKYALSRDLILLRTKDILDINHYYLWVFLHSNIGQKLLWRTASQTGQPHLTLPSVAEIEIPRFSSKQENRYEKFYTLSLIAKNKSQKIYKHAEDILLNSLGMPDFLPNNQNINIKKYSNSFIKSGRLDAEFYQPKYEDYLSLIKNYKYGFEILSQVCNQKDQNFIPNDENEYRYIELSNIGESGDITGYTVALGRELPDRARRIVNNNDVLVSSIEGSLESCALVTEKYDNCLSSTGFYVVNSEKINSETLLVLFKSEPLQAILKQNCSGTILTAINKTEFSNIPIPLIEKSVQTEIKNSIIESNILRENSNLLLKIAKRAVEIAVEESEECAEKYIKYECRKIDIDIDGL